jgi:hypothetical protein
LETSKGELMTLRISEMPCSFTGQALYYAATSSWLGFDEVMPRNATDLVRACVWPVYDVGVNVLCAPAGIVYHSAAAVAHKARSFSTSLPEAQKKQAALAYEHFKAAVTDVAGLGLVLFVYARIRSGSNSRNRLSYADFLWPWFSSSNVQITPSPQLPVNLTHDHIANFLPRHWGNPDLATSRQCSYRELRVRAYEYWEENDDRIDLESPELIPSAVEASWKNLKSATTFFSTFWIQRPSFQAALYIPPRTEEKPSYTIRWQTVAWILGGVAMLCLTCWIANGLYSVWLFSELIVRAQLIFFLGVSAIGTTALFLLGAKNYWENRGVAEKAVGDRLMGEIASDESIAPNGQKAERALHWYLVAARNGDTTSQRLVGLGLLTSLSQHRNATNMNDAELLITKEAVQWLQSTAKNGDLHAAGDLSRLFNFSHNPPPNLDLMISGNTESDRIRNMFPAGHNFVDIALEQSGATESNPKKREKLVIAFLTSRRKPISTQVDKITNLTFNLSDLVVQYLVGIQINANAALPAAPLLLGP